MEKKILSKENVFLFVFVFYADTVIRFITHSLNQFTKRYILVEAIITISMTMAPGLFPGNAHDIKTRGGKAPLITDPPSNSSMA